MPPMNPQGDRTAGTDGETTVMKRRVRLFAPLAAAAILIDAFVLIWVVPWADEITTNPFMSLGYVVVFFLTLFNLLFFIGLLAHTFHGDSFPSDKWK